MFEPRYIMAHRPAISVLVGHARLSSARIADRLRMRVRILGLPDAKCGKGN